LLSMSVVSFALAVVFIIRLFSTSAFRVPNFIKLLATIDYKPHEMVLKMNMECKLLLILNHI